MITWLAIVLLQAAPTPSMPMPEDKACVVENSAINSYVVQTCMPGLLRESMGNAEAPELQPDKTWMHTIPFRAEKGVTLETKICGFDLIDFAFRSDQRVVLNVRESRDRAQHCLTKAFTVPPGPVRLVVLTQTKAPNLVIRSTVLTAPLAAILQPAQAPPPVIVLPPPIIIVPIVPPPVPPPVVVPPPPPF